MAAHDGAFDDLERIMDGNLHRARLVPHGSRTTQTSSHPVNSQEDVDVDEEDDVAASFGNPPLRAAASISLALNSVLTSGFILPKKKEVAHGPAIPGAAPSRKKSRNPVSSKVQVALEAPAATPTVTNSRNYVAAFPEYDRLRSPGFKDPANAAGLRRASLVWFRNDLRVHDNEALVAASRDSLSILPVFCFDPRDYGKSSSGFDKTGPFRAKFLIECVSSLRSSLRDRGSELVVRVGKPEEVLVELAKSVGAEALYVHQEVTYEELQEQDFVAISSNSYRPWNLSHKGVAVKRSWNALNRGPFQAEDKVAAALHQKGVETKCFWGSTLYHLEDLPFKLEDMPSNYAGFREKVRSLTIRDPIEAPQQLKGLPGRGNVKPGRIPSLQELGFSSSATPRQEDEAELLGGEAEALKKLQSFALDVPSICIASQSEQAGGDSLYGANFTCKISPWLALGCLSPRRMFEDLKKNASSAGAMSVKASENGNKNGLNWLLFELLWRDFFRFITKKYGAGKRLNAEATLAAA